MRGQVGCDVVPTHANLFWVLREQREQVGRHPLLTFQRRMGGDTLNVNKPQLRHSVSLTGSEAKGGA